MRTLLLIFALAYTAIGQTPKCPGPYIPVGSGCYTFPDRVDISWIRSSTLCQFSGGYLVNIESEAEQMALAAYHNENFPGINYRWIGLTDVINNGTWRWVTSGAAVIYDNWLSGQPDQRSYYDCVYWASDNSWRSLDCCYGHSDIQPICEADPL